MEVKEYFDLFPKLKEAFPELDESVLKYIIKTGFYVFSKFAFQGMPIKIGNKDTGCGIWRPLSKEARWKRRARKNNLFYIQRKKNFENEYYFAVTDEVKDRVQKRGKYWVLNNIYCSKVLDNVITKQAVKVYALELTDVGMSFLVDHLKTDRVKLIMQRDKNGKLKKI